MLSEIISGLILMSWIFCFIYNLDNINHDLSKSKNFAHKAWMMFQWLGLATIFMPVFIGAQIYKLFIDLRKEIRGF